MLTTYRTGFRVWALIQPMSSRATRRQVTGVHDKEPVITFDHHGISVREVVRPPMVDEGEHSGPDGDHLSVALRGGRGGSSQEQQQQAWHGRLGVRSV